MDAFFHWALMSGGSRNGSGIMLLFVMHAVALAGCYRRRERVPISKAEFSS
jgi:hypothetical protein